MRYQQVFDAAIGEAPPTTVDIDQVVRRQRRAAKVRPALAVAATVLVAAAGVALGAGQLGGDDSTPVAPADQLAGFPEYADGTRVIAAEAAPVADRTLILTFTPTTLDLVLSSRCDSTELNDRNLGLRAELSVGEVTANLPYCPVVGIYEGGWEGAEAWSDFWAATGIEPGEPAIATVTLTEVEALAVAADPPPLPSVGTFGLAVAERVPFEEYLLPERTAELAPLPAAGAGVPELLRADPTDPNQRVEATMVWEPGLAGCGAPGRSFPLELVSQTPGSLRVLINDVEVADHTWWDYQQEGSAFALTALCGEFDQGDEVTIAVQPEHLTGDWLVRVNGTG